jgi:hypothetical protein
MTFAQLDDELQYAGALKAADNCENYWNKPTNWPTLCSRKGIKATTL